MAGRGRHPHQALRPGTYHHSDGAGPMTRGTTSSQPRRSTARPEHAPLPSCSASTHRPPGTCSPSSPSRSPGPKPSIGAQHVSALNGQHVSALNGQHVSALNGQHVSALNGQPDSPHRPTLNSSRSHEAPSRSTSREPSSTPPATSSRSPRRSAQPIRPSSTTATRSPLTPDLHSAELETLLPPESPQHVAVRDWQRTISEVLGPPWWSPDFESWQPRDN